jgi:hypothetical protein
MAPLQRTAATNVLLRGLEMAGFGLAAGAIVLMIVALLAERVG